MEEYSDGNESLHLILWEICTCSVLGWIRPINEPLITAGKRVVNGFCLKKTVER